MCLLGLVGVVLMVVENEITFRRAHDKDTQVSWLLKVIITATTTALLVLVCYYHYLSLRLYTIQNALHDCRIGVTPERVFWIVLELLICAVHPMPRVFPLQDPVAIETKFIPRHSLFSASVDVSLGLPSKCKPGSFAEV